MRVLLEATQAGNLSGTGVYTRQLVRQLPNVSPDLHLQVLWPQSTPAPELDAADRVDLVPGRPSGLGRLVDAQVAAPRLYRRQECDLLHYPASVANIAGHLRTVVTVHDLSFLRHPEWFRPGRAAYYRWAVVRSARRAALVLADSQATADDLRELARIPDDRIRVVPLGVEESFHPARMEEVQRVRQEYGLPERFFLYMGTLEPRKNLMRILEAWSRCARSLPLDLVFAGRHGWKITPFLRAILEHPESHRIHLPGYIAPIDQAAVYSAADAFVWPSLYEGFGLPPLEAMACGTPVLTSNNSSIPEAVGEGALRVDPEDVEAIAEGMRQLATDTGLRRQLIGRGRAQAAQFTWRRTAEETFRAYEQALQAR